MRLTQEGFIDFNISIVSEILPDGFEYMYDSYTGAEPPTYHTNNNTLVMVLGGADEITETYTVYTGTFGQIVNARFTGTYQSWDGSMNGSVTGDDTLTPPHDLNGDGKITSTDALIALQMACGNCAPVGNADVSGDDRITSLDALMLMQVASE